MLNMNYDKFAIKAVSCVLISDAFHLKECSLMNASLNKIYVWNNY